MGAEADFGGFAGDAVESFDFGSEFGFVPADDGAIRGEEKDASDADFGGHADRFLEFFGFREAEGEGDSLGGFGVWLVGFDREGGFTVECADEGATIAREKDDGAAGGEAEHAVELLRFFGGEVNGFDSGVGDAGHEGAGERS